jgi:5-methylthioadenosine/S-adenosylhomocysteine deaminase
MAPKIVDLRIDATWVVPVEPAGVLTDHALIVDGGIIVDVVATTDTVRYAPRAQVSLPHHVLIPGLVNAHTHAAMTLLRGIADDVPLRPWLTDHIWPREGRFVSADFVYDGTLIGAAEMLRGGITCCNDMYFHPDAAARAYEAAGMRALVGVPILDFPTPYAADADAYLQRGLAARDAFKPSPRLTIALAPHAPYTVEDATWRKIVMYAGQLELPIETHVAETRAEVEEARAQTGSAPLARLARLGAMGPDFIAIHAVHLDAADIDLLATHGCHVVHCPASNMKLASGIAPVTALRARGINVALGTDGAASNNRLDVLGEMRLASLIAKAATGDAAALPAAEVLHMATLGGARALGLGDTTGSLVPGKQADIAAIDLSGVQALPVYDPVSHIVHVAERADVSHVWVAGAPVVADRALLALDVAALAARARAWQAKLR